MRRTSFWFALPFFLALGAAVTEEECLWRYDNSTSPSVQLLEKSLITDNESYDPTVRPSVAISGQLEAPADVVHVQFFLVSFTLSELTQSMNARGYLRLYWQDPRLAYEDPEGCDNPKEWVLTEGVDIWRPDIFGENMREWSDRESFSSGTWIYPDGTVFDSSYTNSVFECKIRATDMPFDDHKCWIRLSSYTMYSRDLRVFALPDAPPIDVTDTTQHNIWKVEKSTASEFEKIYSVGNFDIVDLNLHVARKPRFHIIYSMIPALLFLLISYTGFFIARDCAPARCTVAIIPVLTMRLLINAIFSRMETVSYFIYLASFLNAAMFLSCACVVEYALVQFLMHKESEAMKRRKAIDVHKNKNNSKSSLSRRPSFLAPRAEQESKTGDGGAGDDWESPQMSMKTTSTTEDDPEAFEKISCNPLGEQDTSDMRRIFDKYSTRGVLDSASLSLVMRYHYGVYIDAACARDTMLFFGYKNGMRIPKKRSSVALDFAQFQELVVHYDEKYNIGRDETEQNFISKPNSLKTDYVARWCFLPICAIVFGLHYYLWIVL